jgi:hypothetical protein
LVQERSADVDESVYTFFQFYEDTEVGEVANLSGMLASNRIFHLDGFPWVLLELLDAEDILRSSRSSVRITASTSSPTCMNSCAERRCWLQDISLKRG